MTDHLPILQPLWSSVPARGVLHTALSDAVIDARVATFHGWSKGEDSAPFPAEPEALTSRPSLGSASFSFTAPVT